MILIVSAWAVTFWVEVILACLTEAHLGFLGPCPQNKISCTEVEINKMARFGAGRTVEIGGLFPIHSWDGQRQRCAEDVQDKGYQRMEAMRYAVALVNNNSKLLPDLDLIYHIGDTCANSLHAISESLMPMLNLQTAECEDGVASAAVDFHARVVAVIGAASSTVSKSIASMLRPFRVTQISYASTSNELSNGFDYPFFLRTVSPDRFQARVMVALAKRFHWTYLKLIHSDDLYGRGGAESFIKESFAQGICVARTSEIETHSESGDATYITALDMVFGGSAARSRVIIVFAAKNAFRKLLRLARTHPQVQHHKLIWIASDSTGEDLSVAREALEVVDGMFTVLPYAPPLPGFDKFLLNLRPGEKYHADYVATQLKCKQNATTGSNLACDYSKLPLHYSQNGKVPFVVDAVFAVAAALHHILCQDSRTCKKPGDVRDISIKVRDFLIASGTTLTDANGNPMRFDRNGDPTLPTYRISNLVLDGTARFATVGSWKILKNGEQSLVFNDGLAWPGWVREPPTSTCSDPCGLGEYPQSTGGKLGSCCWSCVRCQGETAVNVTLRSCMACAAGERAVANNTVCEPLHLRWPGEESAFLVNSLVMCVVNIMSTALFSIVWYRKHSSLRKKTASEKERFRYKMLQPEYIKFLLIVAWILSLCGFLEYCFKPANITCPLILIPHLAFSLMILAPITTGALVFSNGYDLIYLDNKFIVTTLRNSKEEQLRKCEEELEDDMDAMPSPRELSDECSHILEEVTPVTLPKLIQDPSPISTSNENTTGSLTESLSSILSSKSLSTNSSHHRDSMRDSGIVTPSVSSSNTVSLKLSPRQPRHLNLSGRSIELPIPTIIIDPPKSRTKSGSSFRSGEARPCLASIPSAGSGEQFPASPVPNIADDRLSVPILHAAKGAGAYLDQTAGTFAQRKPCSDPRIHDERMADEKNEPLCAVEPRATTTSQVQSKTDDRSSLAERRKKLVNMAPVTSEDDVFETTNAVSSVQEDQNNTTDTELVRPANETVLVRPANETVDDAIEPGYGAVSSPVPQLDQYEPGVEDGDKLLDPGLSCGGTSAADHGSNKVSETVPMPSGATSQISCLACSDSDEGTLQSTEVCKRKTENPVGDEMEMHTMEQNESKPTADYAGLISNQPENNTLLAPKKNKPSLAEVERNTESLEAEQEEVKLFGTPDENIDNTLVIRKGSHRGSIGSKNSSRRHSGKSQTSNLSVASDSRRQAARQAMRHRSQTFGPMKGVVRLSLNADGSPPMSPDDPNNDTSGLVSVRELRRKSRQLSTVYSTCGEPATPTNLSETASASGVSRIWSRRSSFLSVSTPQTQLTSVFNLSMENFTSKISPGPVAAVSAAICAALVGYFGFTVGFQRYIVAHTSAYGYCGSVEGGGGIMLLIIVLTIVCGVCVARAQHCQASNKQLKEELLQYTFETEWFKFPEDINPSRFRRLRDVPPWLKMALATHLLVLVVNGLELGLKVTVTNSPSLYVHTRHACLSLRYLIVIICMMWPLKNHIGPVLLEVALATKNKLVGEKRVRPYTTFRKTWSRVRKPSRSSRGPESVDVTNSAADTPLQRPIFDLGPEFSPLSDATCTSSPRGTPVRLLDSPPKSPRGMYASPRRVAFNPSPLSVVVAKKKKSVFNFSFSGETPLTFSLGNLSVPSSHSTHVLNKTTSKSDCQLSLQAKSPSPDLMPSAVLPKAMASENPPFAAAKSKESFTASVEFHSSQPCPAQHGRMQSKSDSDLPKEAVMDIPSLLAKSHTTSVKFYSLRPNPVRHSRVQSKSDSDLPKEVLIDIPSLLPESHTTSMEFCSLQPQPARHSRVLSKSDSDLPKEVMDIFSLEPDSHTTSAQRCPSLLRYSRHSRMQSKSDSDLPQEVVMDTLSPLPESLTTSVSYISQPRPVRHRRMQSKSASDLPNEILMDISSPLSSLQETPLFSKSKSKSTYNLSTSGPEKDAKSIVYQRLATTKELISRSTNALLDSVRLPNIKRSMHGLSTSIPSMLQESLCKYQPVPEPVPEE